MTLPMWVQICQALAVPVIAAVGTWIALQQMHLARVKLQHDLYDRRYAVFNSARMLLEEVVTNKLVSADTFNSFVIGTLDSPFLFDDKLATYLAELRKRAKLQRSITVVIQGMEGVPGAERQKAAASSKEGEHLVWLVKQIDVLPEKFRPFLQLDQRSRTALRRIRG